MNMQFSSLLVRQRDVYRASSCVKSSHVRESVFRNPGNFCLRILNAGKFCWWNPESWAVESGIQLKESGIPLKIGLQKPSSSEKDWNAVPGNVRNRWHFFFFKLTTNQQH